jgi:hypothetical protein
VCGNPTKVKRLPEVMAMIGKWEIYVHRLKTNFNDKLSNGLKTGILVEMLLADIA